MTTGYINLPVAGGGGGTGNILSINGDTSANQFIVGSNAITVNSSGGITTIGASGNTNTVAGYDNSGNLYSIPGWQFDPTSFGPQVFATQNVINDGFHNWGILFLELDPSIASPTTTWNNLSLQANIDANSGGFDFGTDGQFYRALEMNISHNGTSNIGSFNFIQMEGNLGNGTDPFTVKGYNYCSGYMEIRSGVTMDGQMQGYTFQPLFDAGALSTSNLFISAFNDGLNAPGLTIHGYNSVSVSPNFGMIPNGNGFTGVNIGPTITTFAGNAGFNGVSVNPTITTMDTGGFSGFNASPTISGGTGDVNLFNCNMNNVSSTSQNINVLNLSGLTALGGQSGFQADNVHMNIGGTLVAASNEGVQSQHVMFTQFSLPSSAVTGTDVLMNVLSPDVDFGTIGASLSVGPDGLGTNMVAFAGQLHGHGTIQQLSALLPGSIFADDFTLPEWRNVNAIVLNAGYSGTCTNASAFYHEILGAGLFATNHWGLRVVTDVDNYVTKMAVNTSSQKVTNASCAIEIGGVDRVMREANLTTTQRLALTPLAGMICFDTTLTQMAYYNGTSWVIF